MTVATATEKATAAAAQEPAAAPSSRLGPPFWGWEKFKTPSPRGFWSAHDWNPADGTLVNQLGRQSAGAPVGLKFVAYKKRGLDFGGQTIVTARFEPVSFSVIGANIQHWVYMQAGGAFSRAPIYPGRTVNLGLRVSGTRDLTAGCYQLHGYGSQYGEIICRVADLTQYSIWGPEGAELEGSLALAEDDEEKTAIEAALESGDSEEIPFEARKLDQLPS